MNTCEKLFLSVREAAFLLGIGRTKLYGLIKVGDITPAKLGHRTLIHRHEVEALAARLVPLPRRTETSESPALPRFANGRFSEGRR